jgi:hypothetical protein
MWLLLFILQRINFSSQARKNHIILQAVNSMWLLPFILHSRPFIRLNPRLIIVISASLFRPLNLGEDRARDSGRPTSAKLEAVLDWLARVEAEWYCSNGLDGEGQRAVMSGMSSFHSRVLPVCLSKKYALEVVLTQHIYVSMYRYMYVSTQCVGVLHLFA